MSCLLQANFQTVIEQVHPAEDTTVRRAQRNCRDWILRTQGRASQKTSCTYTGTRKKSNEHTAALKMQFVPKPVFFSSKLELCTLLNQFD